MEVPSGKDFTKQDLDLLKLMHCYGSIKHSKDGFTLKSGVRSEVYVMLRADVTDNPDLGWALGRKVAQVVADNYRKSDKAPCLIGIPTAATGIVAAASLAAKDNIRSLGGPISYRVMRETVKDHGAGADNWVNGAYDDKHTFWVVDNVVTDCMSKIEAAERLTASGYPALEMPWLIVVDRQQGGIERMKQHGFERIVVTYGLLDIAYAMGELGLWPKSVVKSVEEEIAAHQFLMA